MTNQATIATGTYDPFTNGRTNFLRHFRKSRSLFQCRMKLRLAISTSTPTGFDGLRTPVAGWCAEMSTNPRLGQHLQKLLRASLNSFALVLPPSRLSICDAPLAMDGTADFFLPLSECHTRNGIL